MNRLIGLGLALAVGGGQAALAGSNSDLFAQVLVDYSQVERRLAPLSVGVFRGTRPVQGAQVWVTLTNWATRKSTRLRALDDGKGSDLRAGDGLYSLTLGNLEPAFFLAAADVTAGKEQVHAANFYAVNEQTAHLTGQVSDQGLDDDGDGQIDRIALTFPVAWVKRAGRYIIDAVLQGGGQQVDSNDAVVNLKPGSRSATIFFDAKEVAQKLNKNGPYHIKEVQFMWMPERVETRPGDHTIQRWDDLGQSRAYNIAHIGQPLIRFTRFVSEKPIDRDGNGLIDDIAVTFEVQSRAKWPVLWIGCLIPLGKRQGEAEMSCAKSKTMLYPGLNTLSLTFDVRPLGAAGLSGPFGVVNLEVQPAQGGQSNWPAGYGQKGYGELAALPESFGKTRAYSLKQLERGR